MNDLVEFWRKCDLDRPPYIHIDDKPYIEAAVNVVKTMLPSHRAFVEHPSFGDENDSSLHLSLLPVPYQGNLSQADILIVMLNPGLGLSDYQTEEDRLSDHELANYDPKLARGAALGPGTPGGNATINALKTRPPR